MARILNVRRGAVALPLFVFVLGTLVAGASALWMRHQAERHAATAFERRVDHIDADIRRRLSLALYGLEGAKAALASHPPFTPASFAAYIASRDLPREFPGVRGFGYVERVPAAELDAFERRVQAEGAPDFHLHAPTAAPTPQAAAGDRFVIRAMEPAARNPGALGLDLSFEPRRRQGIDRAIETGMPALSAPIALVQDATRRPGFLLVVPVFREGTQPRSAAERDAALQGLLVAPLVAAEVLEGVPASSAQDFAFELTLPRAASGGAAEAIYRRGTVDAGAAGAAASPAGRHHAVRTIALPGYDARLTVRSSAAFDDDYPTLPSWLTLLGGIFTSAFLAGLFHLQGSAQRRAEAMAERMTVELAQLAVVARRTSNAVIITDRALRITWVNEGFTRLYGHTMAQALGQTPGALLGTPETDTAAIRTLADATAAGSGCRVEVVNRTRDGRRIWLDIDVQPTLDDAGNVVGFVEISLDITERRQTELQAATLLRENQALLGTIRSHTIFSMTDAAGTIIEVNDAFCSNSGYTRDELLGHSHALLSSGVQPPAFWQAMWQTIASGQPWRGQICNRARDGSSYWVDSMIAPITGVDGQIAKYVSIRTDITESKHAVLELAAERQRLADIIDGTEAGTWECDLLSEHSSELDSDRVRISGAYAALTGRGVDECKAQMQPSFLALLHPADVAATRQALDDHLQQRTPVYEAEYRARHKDGHWVWIQSRGKVSERDAEGRPLRISGIVLDISLRKQAERDMARQRRALENIIDGTNAATWEWAVETGAVQFNTRWMQMVGCSAAELEAPVQDWLARVHADDQLRIREAVLVHLRGASLHLDCEYRLRHAGGHWIWLHSRGKVIGRNPDGRARWMAGTHVDITQRRHAEAALAASQAFLDQTGRIAGVGGWQVDLATQELTWSEQTCRIHDLPPGHRPTLTEAVGHYAAEAQRTVAEAVEHSSRTGEGFDLELPMTTATGRAIWVRSVGNVERLDGKPVRLVGAFQDTTAAHALQDALRCSNALMSTVLANLPCALSVFDGDLTLTVSNEVFGQLLGLPPELNVPGQTRLEHIIRYNAERGEYGAGDPEVIVGTHLQRIAGGVVPYQFERVRINGTVLEVRGAPMPGGGFVSTYTDVTARHRAEAEVQRSERLLRGAIDAIDEAFVLFDPDDRFVFCNDKYRRTYARSTDLIAPGTRFEDIIRRGAERGEIPEAVGRVDAWVAERLLAHQAGKTTPLQRLASGRTMRVVERRMQDGHIVGFRIDVTELVRATETAHAASQAKSQFLANMSHEIRTPMNAILGMLALLRKTELNARQSDYAAKTEGAARSLLGLLNDILDFSKIEAGKMTLDPQPFALEPLLQDLSVILSANVGDKPVELLFDIDPAVPPGLLGDALRLQQVLINLAGNAVKFTQRGEVVVSVAVCPGAANRTEGDVTLEVAVRDTGIGIAPENQDRIFSGFTQAEASTTRRFGGTGLGVVISQRLVAMMGGELKLDSALGQGSRFHFRLTLPVAPMPLTSVSASAPKPMRALVVDDNPTARELLQRMGESLGWQVEAAAGGEAAMAMIDAASSSGPAFDAVFIDWQMPGLDGWQTSRRIRERQGDRSGKPALVVMVTAHGRDLLAQRPADEQALLDAFLVKPVTAAMLAGAVDEARSRDTGTPAAGASAPTVQPSLRRLAGLRLLLVEDNPNNQQVACELLEDEGANVVLAADGSLAVAAVLATVSAARPSFDAVLMDLQMPVMDGFTATSEIRQTLGLSTEQLPIVAMTANAMASDREACLAAGMNDHVGKPFDIDHLVALLQRWCPRPARSDSAAAITPSTRPSQPLPTTVREAARHAGVDIDAALARLGDKPALYWRMLGGFLAELEAGPTLLQTCLNGDDAQAAARLAHSWRGVAATLGATTLAHAAAVAETTLRDGHAAPGPVVKALLITLQTACADLLTLHRALAPLCAPTALPPPASDPGAARRTLQQDLRALALLLAQSDMAALAANAALQARYRGVPGLALQALDDAVGNLDFPSALQQCRALHQVHDR